MYIPWKLWSNSHIYKAIPQWIALIMINNSEFVAHLIQLHHINANEVPSATFVATYVHGY